MLVITTPADSYDLTTADAVKAEMATDNDELLAEMITQASEAIAGHCGRVLALETVEETLRIDRCASRLSLARWPVAEIASVTENGTILEASDYELDSGSGVLVRLCNDRESQWSPGKIVIAYKAGYDDEKIPEALQRASIELVKAWWGGKDRDPAVRDVEYSDGSKIAYQIGAPALPAIVVELLAPFCGDMIR